MREKQKGDPVKDRLYEIMRIRKHPTALGQIFVPTSCIQTGVFLWPLEAIKRHEQRTFNAHGSLMHFTRSLSRVSNRSKKAEIALSRRCQRLFSGKEQ